MLATRCPVIIVVNDCNDGNRRNAAWPDPEAWRPSWRHLRGPLCGGDLVTVARPGPYWARPDQGSLSAPKRGQRGALRYDAIG